MARPARRSRSCSSPATGRPMRRPRAPSRPRHSRHQGGVGQADDAAGGRRARALDFPTIERTTLVERHQGHLRAAHRCPADPCRAELRRRLRRRPAERARAPEHDHGAARRRHRRRARRSRSPRTRSGSAPTCRPRAAADRSTVSLSALTANLGPVARPDGRRGRASGLRPRRHRADPQPAADRHRAGQKDPNGIASRALPALLYRREPSVCATRIGQRGGGEELHPRPTGRLQGRAGCGPTMPSCSWFRTCRSRR